MNDDGRWSWLNFYTTRPPIVTRIYFTACVLTSLAVYWELVTPYALHFSPSLVVRNFQLWRILTSFVYYGTVNLFTVVNLNLIYHIFRIVEDSTYEGRTADFIWMLIVVACTIVVTAFCFNIMFLGNVISCVLVNVWCHRNPTVEMSAFGILNFSASWLPFFALVVAVSFPIQDSIKIHLVGGCIGQLLYYLEDVFPTVPRGYQLIRTPQFLRNYFDRLQHRRRVRNLQRRRYQHFVRANAAQDNEGRGN